MSAGAQDDSPGSPCISVCVIDGPSGLCAGCYRTLDEIAAWIDLPDVERRAILGKLASRRAEHGLAIARRQSAYGQR
ncbi:MAG TPA: DUF1289 domain-containing protein [Casimicrobiaceae bacterium]|nr:DUF1289 domain-containing protein [Casimicrobiaceae bacterium]